MLARREGEAQPVGARAGGGRGAEPSGPAGDLHTHLRQPGREDAETIESGSRAAALGGYTAILAMPNTTPPIDCAAVVREVLELGRAAVCDVHTLSLIHISEPTRPY